MKATVISGMPTAAIALGAPAHADPDADFNNRLHGYGIYGPRDYNAWLGGRQRRQVGRVPFPQTTAAQSWQFLAAAITTYCPDQTRVLTSVAGPNH